MKINEIKTGMSNVALQAKVIEVSPTRDVQTRYGPKSVADAILEDDTGQISLSLWEDNINSVSMGDVVNVSGAYVTQFRDKVQLNVPKKSGSIQVVKE
jgi:replication factor A1